MIACTTRASLEMRELLGATKPSGNVFLAGIVTGKYFPSELGKVFPIQGDTSLERSVLWLGMDRAGKWSVMVATEQANTRGVADFMAAATATELMGDGARHGAGWARQLGTTNAKSLTSLVLLAVAGVQTGVSLARETRPAEPTRPLSWHGCCM